MHLFSTGFPVILSSVFRKKNRYVKSKLFILFLVTVIVSAGIGISYANSNDTLTADGFAEGYCDVVFTSVSVSDNEVEKFVGDVGASIVNAGKGISVNIDHAYPSYEVYIDFTIQNTGSLPIDVNGLLTSSFDDSVMGCSISGFDGVSFLPSGSFLSGVLTLTVLDSIKQNSVYAFSFDFGFSNDDFTS
jgi:hypothetical protein